MTDEDKELLILGAVMLFIALTLGALTLVFNTFVVTKTLQWMGVL